MSAVVDARRAGVLYEAAAAGDLLLRAGQVLHRAPETESDPLRPVREDPEHLHATSEDAWLVGQMITEGRLSWTPDGQIRPSAYAIEEL